MSLSPTHNPAYRHLTDAQVLSEFVIYTDQRKLLYKDYDMGSATEEDLEANESKLLSLEDELHAREIDIPKVTT